MPSETTLLDTAVTEQPSADAVQDGDQGTVEQPVSEAEGSGQAGTSDSDSVTSSLLDTGGRPDQEESTEDDDASLSDWREEFSGGDEKLKGVISRYRSPKDVAKALADAKKFIRDNRAGVHALSDDASEEEIAEFRKAMGVPETAKDYEISWADNGEPSPEDAAILESFADAMHQNNATPKQLQAAVDWYNDQVRSQQQAARENQYETQVETQTTLKSEWGGEYKANLNAIKQFTVAQLDGDEEAATDLFQTRLSDGSLLGDHLPFIKMLATPAVDYVGPNAIFSGDTARTTHTLEERKDELLQLRNTDPNRYKSAPVQSELAKIYDKLEKLENRG